MKFKALKKHLIYKVKRTKSYFQQRSLRISWLSTDINPFHVKVLLLYPLKTSENQRFSEGKEMGQWREK